jgi:hypothetical protein
MAGPFDRLPHTAADDFRLWFYAAVLMLRNGLSPDVADVPFLASYSEEIAATGVNDPERWLKALERWEDASEERLALRELRRAGGLEPIDLAVLFLVGLGEEDAGFGAVMEMLRGPGHLRPTVGLLQTLVEPAGAVRDAVRRLSAAGALTVLDAQLPQPAWELAVDRALWSVLREGEPELAPAMRWLPTADLPALDELILPAALAEQAERAAGALREGSAGTLLVRGRPGSGRHTLARAIAQALGRGTLELDGPHPAAGALATALDALPVDVLDLAPGETAALQPLSAHDGARAVLLGLHGGVDGALDGALVLDVGLPGIDERKRHWAEALGREPDGLVVDQYRMTGGHIRRTAALARAQASLSDNERPSADDVRLAARTLHGQLLDTLAARLPAADPDWGALALSSTAARELRLLELRCRERERLADAGGPALRGQSGAGVRALLTGPSGTGKTLAARVLAGRLGLDAYRLDLSTVVDKYLGETEKNLERALSHAEAANALLLLDEGDALLTRRTSVQTSNDRYANLETNFLLQRLESFEGILVVTTNAGERIDAAFRRRMDVIVDFRAPEAPERLRILELHLPEEHEVDERMLRTVAARCPLAGGQLRNAVLHAELLALEEGGPLAAAHLDEAIRREYRKAGATCPLPAAPEAVGA